uniref:non-specific serine/threonine protein kinase n=1 Tax=Culicoides sonorensis TaxID=179676 RepID=A0A336LU41_CULSO
MKMASKPKISRKKNAYEMPKKVARGTVLVDSSKVSWIVGSSIGKGGFGEIYCVSKVSDKVKTEKNYEYVLKIEPHENGPLFVEMHFYMRNAKFEDIEAFKKSHKLSSLGMPHFVGSGSHMLEGVKHRFVIMPRYGEDIWSYYIKNGKIFPIHTVYRLALQMIDVLEYIHHCTYVHGDLKGANMLLKGDSQVYLVDFGLASHYVTSSAYKTDPRKMHNGTIEYTSIDAHNGVPTMRGDLEILGYNLIHWSGGKLPWENCLNDPKKVQDSKESYKGNAKKLMKDCYGNSSHPVSVQSFFDMVYVMLFNEKPNYEKYRKIFLQELKSLQKSNSGPLDLTFTEKPTKGTAAKKTSKPSPKAKAKGTSSAKLSSTRQNSKTKDATDDAHEHVYTCGNGNAKIVLNTPSKGKKDDYKKICQINLDLDISIDTDVVVNVKRKDKKKVPTVEVVNQEEQSSQEVQIIQSDNEDIEATTPERKSTRKRRQQNDVVDEVSKPKVSRKDKATNPKIVMRAGEYKGMRAKK